MKSFFILIIVALGQTLAFSQTRQVQYTYDENGNRESRYIVYLRTVSNGGDPNQNIESPDVFAEEDGVSAELDGARFTVFPNPTTSVIRTEWQMEDGEHVSVKEMRLIGLDGKPVQTFFSPALPLEIDMQAVPKGTYILWIMPANGEIRRVKIVKQ
jgi:hypothetical protein